MPAPPNRTAVDYLEMLQGLLPRGLAWTRAIGSNLHGTLFASAEELARIDGMTHLLISEANPLSTINGLEDWERVLGLPDACNPAGSTIQERRDAVIAKLRDIGRQDLAYWYELADTLGFAVSIEEHWPFVCGWHQCGDPQGGWTEESGMSIEQWEQQVGYPIGRLGPEEIRYWWNVIVHGDRLVLFRCGESVNPELLMGWSPATVLECLMQRDKEAHTLLTFEYREF